MIPRNAIHAACRDAEVAIGESEKIDSGQWCGYDVEICIKAAQEPDRIGFYVASDRGIVVSVVVVNRITRRDSVVPKSIFPRRIRQLQSENEDRPPQRSEFFPRGAFSAARRGAGKGTSTYRFVGISTRCCRGAPACGGGREGAERPRVGGGRDRHFARAARLINHARGTRAHISKRTRSARHLPRCPGRKT